ncbi:MAG: LCP family protein [Bacillota bacterium]
MAKGKLGFKRFFKAGLLLLILFGLGIIAVFGYDGLTRSDNRGVPPGPDSPREAIAAQRFNFLLLGSDARDGEIRSRCDSIVFASADTGNKRLVLLSIPRDTLVDIPGHGKDRINATMAYGGPRLSTRVVSDLIGQPINYYVVTNYEGFIRLVDALGGVTLEVDKNMYHYDPEKGGRFTIRLKKGLQHLDGEKALMYVRYRGDPLGDIKRVERQQKFLCAVIEEMLKPRNLIRLPVLIPKIKDCIYTNLPLGQMISLVKMARNMDDLQVLSGTLPGYLADDPYWHVDPDEAKKAVAQLLLGEPIPRVVKETPAGVVIARAKKESAVAGEVYPEKTVPADTYESVTGDSYGGDMVVEIIPGPAGGPPGAGEQPSETGPPVSEQPDQQPPQAEPSQGETDDSLWPLRRLLGLSPDQAEPPREETAGSIYSGE